MRIERTALEGVLIITPRRFGDERGFFSESWSRRAMEDAGIAIDFVQDNHSLSRAPGTVRGLHYQAPPVAQDKLVRCGRGRLLDVAVDARRGSPSYGAWVAEELSFEDGRQLLVPAGFLHGFATLEPDTEVVYKCSAPYSAEHDGAVRWNSAGVDWGASGWEHGPVLSDKDARAPLFSEWESPFEYRPAG